MDISVRDVTEQDLVAVDEIVTTAFRSTGSRMADLQRLFALRPEAWLLACVQGEPVGTVAAVDYGPFAYVGDMTVLPQLQRQGIGTLLMERLLRYLDARGTPLVLLDASEAGAPLYRRFGFIELDGTCFFTQARKYETAPARTRVRLVRTEEVDALAHWDAPYFGANRARVLHQFVAEFPERAWIAEDEGGAYSGYLFAQGHRLGPWVARQPQDAKALLQAALSVPSSFPWRVIIPEGNSKGIEMLQRAGFRLVDASHRHMGRGTTGLARQRDAIYAQASYSLG